MPRKNQTGGLVSRVREQLLALRDPDYEYQTLQLYLAGVSEPWEFAAEDEFEFYEDVGVLVVRNGPTGENGNDNASVPEYVFRLDAVVASQLA